MSSRIRRSLAGVLAIVSALALSACSFPARASGSATLRIGITVWPGYEPLYLAQEIGTFERAGADVRIVEFTSGGDLMRALAHGEIDGVASTLVELLTLRAQLHRALQAVLVLDYSNGGDVLAADPSITSISDLRGKRIALEPSLRGTVLLARSLERAGLSFSDVDLAPVDRLEMPGLAASHAVSAAVAYPPVSFELLDHGYRSLADSSQIPEEIVDVLSFDARTLRDRHDAVTRVVRAWDRSLDYARRHPRRAEAIMAGRELVSPVEFRSSAAGVRLMTLADQRHLVVGDPGLEQTCRRTARLLVAAGLLRADPARTLPCVDPEPMRARLRDGGP